MASQQQKWCLIDQEVHGAGHEFHEVAAFVNSDFSDYPTATVAFDSEEELLWAATASVSTRLGCMP